MAFFWKSNTALKEKTGNAIASVAVSTLESTETFRSKAKLAANELGAECVSVISSFFHTPPKKPAELNGNFEGLGAWMAVCQFATFEILYNLREDALPLLRKVAFGKYDWTQGNAVEILCRLAAEGIEREKIIAELKRELPKMRYEAHLYAAEPLLKLAQANPKISEVLKELDVEEFQEAIEEILENSDEN